MFEEKQAASQLAISASVKATTSPYEGIDECDFLELTMRQNALGLDF